VKQGQLTVLKYHRPLLQILENNLFLNLVRNKNICRREHSILAKNQSHSRPSNKVTGTASSKNPGGKVKGSVDGEKVSPPPKKR
jgi:hypothetical protein